MERRKFNKILAFGAVGSAFFSGSVQGASDRTRAIRLGGPLFTKYSSPDGWIKALISLGYRAAYCPVQPGESETLIRDYANAAAKADIIIAEVGAWSNPIDPDDVKSREALEKCIRSLELAELIGARCCVNISGSRNPSRWAGPHKENLTADTFGLIVETTRKIIDAVKPVRTYYSLETMPWAYPDSVESYFELIKAIDRKQFGVHLDPVNLMVSPQVYYKNSDLIRDCFRKLGSRVRSCHAKDILLLDDKPQTQLVEIRPGLGNLDYSVFLEELSRFQDVPLMMEHLGSAGEYLQAAQYIREIGLSRDIEI